MLTSNGRPIGLVSAVDVAQVLRVSVADVRRLTKTGALPSRGRGLARRYDLAVIMSDAKAESTICPRCGGVFASRRDLALHQRLAHGARFEESDEAGRNA